MGTSVDVDDDLLAEASRLSGIEHKEELVEEALRMYIHSQRARRLLALQGQIELAPDYDYKDLRRDKP